MNWRENLKINDKVIIKMPVIEIPRNSYMIKGYVYIFAEVVEIGKYIIVASENNDYTFFKNGKIKLTDFHRYEKNMIEYLKKVTLIKWSEEKEKECKLLNEEWHNKIIKSINSKLR